MGHQRHATFTPYLNYAMQTLMDQNQPWFLRCIPAASLIKLFAGAYSA